jgi:hypothetical protein
MTSDNPLTKIFIEWMKNYVRGSNPWEFLKKSKPYKKRSIELK